MRRTIGPALLATLLFTSAVQAEGIAQATPPGPSAPAPAGVALPTGDMDPEISRKIYHWAVHDPSELRALVKEVLCTYVQNPESVEIAFETASPFDTMLGRFPRIEVSMRKTIIKELEIERGYIALEDIAIDLPKLIQDRKFRFRDKGSTDFLFEITEEAVNGLLKRKGNKLKVRNARMRFEDGAMVFSGRMRVLLFRNHVKVRGFFVPKNGTEVHFNPRAMNIDFLPVPGFLLRAIRDRVNPVGDLKDFRFHVDIGAIRTTKTRLLLGSRSFEDHIMAEVEAEREGRLAKGAAWPPEGRARLLGLQSDSLAQR